MTKRKSSFVAKEKGRGKENPVSRKVIMFVEETRIFHHVAKFQVTGVRTRNTRARCNAKTAQETLEAKKTKGDYFPP